ncbi:DUF502 domain-containing protein [Horticoccus luteus]|uniref:DUF502 domain-containing protein n=1 Tax=Horticoccus luteus TaxID=2862869 RepID=A0A8F9TT30_9BACT|nr:DUF502 domain-containing protein [Horticoccus luteus]QYM77541.1 DUF502 domain-containing protein [Horticoccus luteus]
MAETNSRLVSVRNAFFSGLVLLAPALVTIWAFTRIVELVGGSFRPLFIHHMPESLQRLGLLWDVVTTLIVLLLITALGYLSRYVLGKFFGTLLERFIQSIPGVSNVYTTVKQIIATFSSHNRNLFSKVVLVEFPRRGSWVIGFLTSKTQGEAQTKTTQETWTVFVPTTPNPTSGFLVMVPHSDIVELDMSVGDGMKMIISGGGVVPPWSPAHVPPAPIVREPLP